MNERLSLQDLIDLLAKKQEITKKDAESFLRELIAVISENIEDNEPVKIKDFGVFKLVKVNARRSVDVNTGDAIEIAAHYKLSFTPDKLLKESINRPFAHFESVILEEGVSFDNIEKEDISELEESEDVAVDEIESADEISEQSALSSLILQNIASDTPETDLAELEIVPSVAEIIEQRETENKIVEEPLSTSVQDDPSLIENVPSVAEMEKSAKGETEAEVSECIPTPSFEDEPSIETEDIGTSKKRRNLVPLGIFIFIIIVGFLVGGLYYQEIMKFFTSNSVSDNNLTIAVIDDEKSNVSDSLIIDKVDSLSVPIDTISAIEQTPKNNSIHSKKEIDSPASSSALAVITIEPGSTLRNISLEYYGHKSFWVYILEENKDKIKNPNNIPLGTKLVIPSPAKYSINPQDKNSVDIARQKEQKLFSAMGL